MPAALARIRLTQPDELLGDVHQILVDHAYFMCAAAAYLPFWANPFSGDVSGGDLSDRDRQALEQIDRELLALDFVSVVFDEASRRIANHVASDPARTYIDTVVLRYQQRAQLNTVVARLSESLDSSGRSTAEVVAAVAKVLVLQGHLHHNRAICTELAELLSWGLALDQVLHTTGPLLPESPTPQSVDPVDPAAPDAVGPAVARWYGALALECASAAAELTNAQTLRQVQAPLRQEAADRNAERLAAGPDEVAWWHHHEADRYNRHAVAGYEARLVDLAGASAVPVDLQEPMRQLIDAVRRRWAARADVVSVLERHPGEVRNANPERVDFIVLRLRYATNLEFRALGAELKAAELAVRRAAARLDLLERGHDAQRGRFVPTADDPASTRDAYWAADARFEAAASALGDAAAHLEFWFDTTFVTPGDLVGADDVIAEFTAAYWQLHDCQQEVLDGGTTDTSQPDDGAGFREPAALGNVRSDEDSVADGAAGYTVEPGGPQHNCWWDVLAQIDPALVSDGVRNGRGVELAEALRDVHDRARRFTPAQAGGSLGDLKAALLALDEGAKVAVAAVFNRVLYVLDQDTDAERRINAHAFVMEVRRDPDSRELYVHGGDHHELPEGDVDAFLAVFYDKDAQQTVADGGEVVADLTGFGDVIVGAASVQLGLALWAALRAAHGRAVGGPEHRALTTASWTQLQRAIDQLPNVDAQVIRLRFQRGLPPASAARESGWAESDIVTTERAALGRLTELLIADISATRRAWLTVKEARAIISHVRHNDPQRFAGFLTVLSPDRRECLELVLIHGRSVSEIAEVMDRSSGAVSNLRNAGLRELAGSLLSAQPTPVPHETPARLEVPVAKRAYDEAVALRDHHGAEVMELVGLVAVTDLESAIAAVPSEAGKLVTAVALASLADAKVQLLETLLDQVPPRGERALENAMEGAAERRDAARLQLSRLTGINPKDLWPKRLRRMIEDVASKARDANARERLADLIQKTARFEVAMVEVWHVDALLADARGGMFAITRVREGDQTGLREVGSEALGAAPSVVPSPQPELLLGPLLGPEVQVTEVIGVDPNIEIFPEELEKFADEHRWLDPAGRHARLREVTTLWSCAQQSLRQLGIARIPVSRGVPRWPDGVVGAVAEANGVYAAAVAAAEATWAVGMDTRAITWISDTALARLARLEELAALVGAEPAMPQVLASAKTSVQHAIQTLTGRESELQQIHVTFDQAAKTFVARTAVYQLSGRFSVGDSMVATAVVVSRAAPPPGRRVLVFCPTWTLRADGAVSVTRDLCRGLVEAGHEVFVRLGHSVPVGLDVAGMTFIGPRDHDPKRRSRYQMTGDRDLLPPGIDVVIGSEPFSGGVVEEIREVLYPEAKLVYLMHVVDDALARAYGHSERMIERTRNWQRFRVAGADVVVGVGAAVTNAARGLAPEEDPPVFHEMIPGVEFSEQAPVSETGPRKVLLVGRIEDRQKGTREAAQMIRKLNERGLDVELVVRGAPVDQVERIRDELTELAGRTVDVRPVADHAVVVGDYHEADVVISPGPAEGFGKAGLEAAAAGTPIAVRSSSGLGLHLRRWLHAEFSTVEQDFEDPVDVDRWVEHLDPLLRQPRTARAAARALQERLRNRNLTRKAAAVAMVNVIFADSAIASDAT